METAISERATVCPAHLNDAFGCATIRHGLSVSPRRSEHMSFTAREAAFGCACRTNAAITVGSPAYARAC
jgi:hypothetical protein